MLHSSVADLGDQGVEPRQLPAEDRIRPEADKS